MFSEEGFVYLIHEATVKNTKRTSVFHISCLVLVVFGRYDSYVGSYIRAHKRQVLLRPNTKLTIFSQEVKPGCAQTPTRPHEIRFHCQTSLLMKNDLQ